MKQSQIYLSPDEVKQRGRKFIDKQAKLLRKELWSEKTLHETQYV